MKTIRLIRNRARKGSTTVLALMVSMLLMVLVVATMSLTMVNTETSHDYARNKKTFQAADSGITHAKKTMAHALHSFSLPPATTPDDVTHYADDADSGVTENDRDISLLADTGAFINDIFPRGEPTTYGSTEYNADGLYVGYAASVDVYPTGVDRPVAGDIAHTHTFHYAYEVSSQGGAQIGYQENRATRVERGTFDVEVKRPSFATYGYFTHSTRNQFGSQLWFYDGEVYDGPTHVNGELPEGRCAFWGTATFDGAFTAVQPTYEDSLFGGNANPQFNDSVSWGVDQIELPENGWSQARAAMGDYDNVHDTSALTNAEMRTLLGIPVSADPVDNGVYFAENYNLDGSLMGGILVVGDPDSITLTVDGNEQVITIAMNVGDGGYFDGSNTWEFHSNKINGSAWVKYTDPAGDEHITSFSDEFNGLIHVEGEVKSLNGDGTSAGADIQTDHGITVSAVENIYIDDHLTYQVHPDDDIDADNILGLFSASGNIYLGRYAPNDINLHATVMATAEGHGIGAEGIVTGPNSYDYNYPNKGDWNLLGGMIEHTNQTTGVFYSNGRVTGYLWDFDYDERFLEGLAPPYFPYVTKFIITRDQIKPKNWGRKYY